MIKNNPTVKKNENRKIDEEGGKKSCTVAELLPSVRVSVAIDMAASRAARCRTLKNILIHCHNFAQTGNRNERQGRLGALLQSPMSSISV